jgi:hypothetical protein
VLVNLWLNRTNLKSEIAPLLQQMEDLSRSFEDFRFSFISRVCNKVDHECTRMVSRDNQVVEWLRSVSMAVLYSFVGIKYADMTLY